MKQAIEGFLSDTAVFKSANTVMTYKTAMSQFTQFIGDTDTRDLTCQHVIEFARHLGDGKAKPATIATYLAGVMQFYEWLVVDSGRATFDMADLISLKRRLVSLRRNHSARRLPKVPDEGSVQYIMEYARNRAPIDDRRADLRRLRDLLLAETLRCTGCRISELTSLVLGDISADHRAAIVSGKGGRDRPVFFDGAAWSALSTYLSERHGTGWDSRSQLRLNATAPLLMRHNGTGEHALTSKTAREAFYTLAYMAGERPIRPHSMRHRFATRVLAQTKDLAGTQDLLGHASPTTTRIYTQLTTTDRQDIFRSVEL